MQELSLHLLDILENSFNAGSQNIEVKVTEDHEEGFLIIEVNDDGTGMDRKTVEEALDPFYTTKEGKRVGLGLPLFAQASRGCGGEFSLVSEPNRGTRLRATFKLDHPDRQPVGDMDGTMGMMKFTHPEIRFDYKYIRKGEIV